MFVCLFLHRNRLKSACWCCRHTKSNYTKEWMFHSHIYLFYVISGYFACWNSETFAATCICSLFIPFSSGARKAIKESVVINFCRKLTPSYRIQVGQAFFFSNTMYRQPVFWAMAASSAEGCVAPMWLCELPGCMLMTGLMFKACSGLTRSGSRSPGWCQDFNGSLLPWLSVSAIHSSPLGKARI